MGVNAHAIIQISAEHAGDAVFGVLVLIEELWVPDQSVTLFYCGKGRWTYIMAQLKGLSNRAKPYISMRLWLPLGP